MEKYLGGNIVRIIAYHAKLPAPGQFRQIKPQDPAGVKCLLHAMGFMENELRLPLVPTRITTYEKIHRVLDTFVK